MGFTIEELDDALEHDTLLCQVSAVRSLDDGNVLELDFVLRRGGDQNEHPGDGTAGTVGLRCEGVEAWRLDGPVIDSIGIFDDHPALVPFEACDSHLSYRGAATDPEAILGALYLAHSRAVGSFMDIDDVLSGTAFQPGWTTGTVASGPTSLMTAYANALESQGLEPALLPATRYPPVRSAAELKVCVLDAGHVVAARFETIGDLPTPARSRG